MLLSPKRSASCLAQPEGCIQRLTFSSPLDVRPEARRGQERHQRPDLLARGDEAVADRLVELLRGSVLGGDKLTEALVHALAEANDLFLKVGAHDQPDFSLATVSRSRADG